MTVKNKASKNKASKKQPIGNPVSQKELVPGPAASAEKKPSGLEALWLQARELEDQLEQELLDDAVQSARLALDELHAETKTQPFERRRGLRLREKAERVERAFNRLRALRRGELLPERHPDD